MLFSLPIACEKLHGINIHSPDPLAAVRLGQKEKEKEILYMTPCGPKAPKP